MRPGIGRPIPPVGALASCAPALWGAQAASLQFAAACRKHLRARNVNGTPPPGRLPGGAGWQPALPSKEPRDESAAVCWRTASGLRRAGAALLALCLFATAAQAREPWMVLKDCREIPNDSNDADSFHVSVKSKEYIFRLYFVDAPETDAGFPDRVAEQAKYFKVTSAQTLQLGGYARKFVEEKLARPFTVRTCLQDALGRSKKERFYAFIETSEGDLAELLVANGMARVHGSAATPVGLSSPEREWEKLRQLEATARQQKVGGWGVTIGRMTTRLPKQPPKTGADSFDAFFHPEKLAAAAEAEAKLEAAPTVAPPTAKATKGPSVSAGGGKLDPNTASSAEILNVKGIGPVLAGRIIAARPFKAADDLRKVKGIGPKKYEQMRPYFTDPAPSVGVSSADESAR